jgi:hypothetical protein
MRCAPSWQALRVASGRPYNVNFFCHTPPAPDAARDSGLARRAAALLRRGSGLDAATHAAGPGRVPVQRRRRPTLLKPSSKPPW